MPTPTNRTTFINVDFDQLTMDQVLQRLRSVDAESPYGFTVTPNVDHLVRLDKGDVDRLHAVYQDSTLCICDSRIVSRLAALFGIQLPVVPGSDLTRRVLEEVVVDGDRVAIVGGNSAMLTRLRAKFPKIVFVQHSPPMGLLRDSRARSDAAKFVAESHARFSFVAVGSPQGEMIAHEVQAMPSAKGMALCTGAALDFVVGLQRRAPLLMQSLHLEWAHRLFSQPRRLWRRYLLEGPRIFALAYRWSRASGGRA